MAKRQKKKKICFEWRFLFALLIAVLSFVNLWATWGLVNRQQGQAKERLLATRLKLPTPVFVVGYPKTGTTSIHAMFSCAGFRSSHYCCCESNITHTDCKSGRTFSECIRTNKKAKRPVLEGCGEYDVYGQMDAELGRSIHLPQHFDLELLHVFAPQATFLLNLRPASDWVNSVTHWYGLGGRFLTQFRVDIKKVNRNEALEQIYQNHTRYVRDFVKLHPSHALVEVDISNPQAGASLSDAFGVPSSCWGLHNQNKKRDI